RPLGEGSCRSNRTSAVQEPGSSARLPRGKAGARDRGPHRLGRCRRRRRYPLVDLQGSRPGCARARRGEGQGGRRARSPPNGVRELEAKEALSKAREEIEAPIRVERAEITQRERRLEQREENIEKKADLLQNREIDLARREKSVQSREVLVEESRVKLEELAKQ